MKNELKFFILIAFVMMIGISTVAYSDDDDRIIVNNTNGSLTISGFPSTYYGKRVFALDGNGDVIVLAAAKVSSNGTVTLGEISTSGSVTLKVWKNDSDEDILNNYNGSDTLDFTVIIYDTFSENAVFSELLGHGEITVTFNNGIGYVKMGTIIDEDDY